MVHMVLCIPNKVFFNKYIVMQIFTNHYSQNSLNSKYVLCDTLEAQKIGKIIESGTGKGYFQIIIKLNSIFPKTKKMRSILLSLGLTYGVDYKICKI